MSIIDILFEEEQKENPYTYPVVTDKYRELLRIREGVYEKLNQEQRGYFSYLTTFEKEYALENAHMGYIAGFKRAVKLILTECLDFSSSLIK